MFLMGTWLWKSREKGAERSSIFRFAMACLFLLSSCMISTAANSTSCLEGTTLNLWQSLHLNLDEFPPLNSSVSPCTYNATTGVGEWFSMVGDGSFYTLTVCPQDGVYPQFFVAIHTNMNCQQGWPCSSDPCSQLLCQNSSFSEDIYYTFDFCKVGVSWQTTPGEDYEILIFSEESINVTATIKVRSSGYQPFDEECVGCVGCKGPQGVCKPFFSGIFETAVDYSILYKNLPHRGCDGVIGSKKVLDVCGVCGGDNTTCLSGCDKKPRSNKILDACGVCGGDGRTCGGCNGVPEPDPKKRTVYDACGVCGGDNSTCSDCMGVPYGPSLPDECGVCGGNGTSCLDCEGIPYGTAVVDQCGVCGGDNSTCFGCNGVMNSGVWYDICGQCGGNGSSCSMGCDPNVPFSKTDSCGVCNGDNSSCTCVAYENFTLPEMDCRLVGFSLDNIVKQIDTLITTLESIRSKTVLDHFSRVARVRPYVDEEVMESNDFIDACVQYYATALDSFLENEIAPAFGL